MDYLVLKWIHILSSTVLFGTGIGLAFFFFAAHRGCDLSAIRFATRLVVQGDLAFTTPAGIVQLLSGFALVWFLVSLRTGRGIARFTAGSGSVKLSLERHRPHHLRMLIPLNQTLRTALRQPFGKSWPPTQRTPIVLRATAG